MDSFYLLLIFVLLVATAFFVAAEFAFVRVRKSRIDQLIEEGNSTAVVVKKIITNLDDYLSACQLGITITALGIGWVGEPAVKGMIKPYFLEWGIPSGLASPISFAIAFGSITFLHVVLGELAPKSVAIQKSEGVSLLLARPMAFFHMVMYPLIWTLNGAALAILRLFGLRSANEHEEFHSEEELLILMSDSLRNGDINSSEYTFVTNVFKFDEKTAREVMTPRPDMCVIDISDDLDTILDIMEREQYSRFPVIEGDKDHILGMVHSKEFFISLRGNPDTSLHDMVRPVTRLLDTTPLKVLLKTMQRESVHFVVLIDEFGGTSGIVTLENVLEELVGDIRDEFDANETPSFERLEDGSLVVEGKTSISKVNELLGTTFDHDLVDTVGGLIATKRNDLMTGEEILIDNHLFVILEEDGHRYKQVKIRPVETPPCSESLVQ